MKTAVNPFAGMQRELVAWREHRVAKPKRETPLPTIENKWNLSRAQCAVLELLSQGLSQREVGKRLVMAFQTVQSHVQRARERMDAETTAKAVAMWAVFRSQGAP